VGVEKKIGGYQGCFWGSFRGSDQDRGFCGVLGVLGVSGGFAGGVSAGVGEDRWASGK
jgi:hypothetical protein